MSELISNPPSEHEPGAAAETGPVELPQPTIAVRYDAPSDPLGAPDDRDRDDHADDSDSGETGRHTRVALGGIARGVRTLVWSGTRAAYRYPRWALAIGSSLLILGGIALTRPSKPTPTAQIPPKQQAPSPSTADSKDDSGKKGPQKDATPIAELKSNPENPGETEGGGGQAPVATTAAGAVSPPAPATPEKDADEPTLPALAGSKPESQPAPINPENGPAPAPAGDQVGATLLAAGSPSGQAAAPPTPPPVSSQPTPEGPTPPAPSSEPEPSETNPLPPALSATTSTLVTPADPGHEAESAPPSPGDHVKLTAGDLGEKKSTGTDTDIKPTLTPARPPDARGDTPGPDLKLPDAAGPLPPSPAPAPGPLAPESPPRPEAPDLTSAGLQAPATQPRIAGPVGALESKDNAANREKSRSNPATTPEPPETELSRSGPPEGPVLTPTPGPAHPENQPGPGPAQPEAARTPEPEPSRHDKPAPGPEVPQVKEERPATAPPTEPHPAERVPSGATLPTEPPPPEPAPSGAVPPPKAAPAEPERPGAAGPLEPLRPEGAQPAAASPAQVKEPEPKASESKPVAKSGDLSHEPAITHPDARPNEKPPAGDPAGPNLLEEKDLKPHAKEASPVKQGPPTDQPVPFDPGSASSPQPQDRSLPGPAEMVAPAHASEPPAPGAQGEKAGEQTIGSVPVIVTSASPGEASRSIRDLAQAGWVRIPNKAPGRSGIQDPVDGPEGSADRTSDPSDEHHGRADRGVDPGAESADTRAGNPPGSIEARAEDAPSATPNGVDRPDTGPRRQVRSPASSRSSRVDLVAHTVQRNENFWTISRLYYGDGRYYRALWKANSQEYPNIREIHINDVVMVPPIEDLDQTYIIATRTRPTPGGEGEEAGGPGGPAPAWLERPGVPPAGRSVRTTAEGGVIPPRGDGRADTDLELPAGQADLGPAGRGAGDEMAADPAAPRLTARPRDPAPIDLPVYKVRRYDTLRSIARETLGDSHRSEEIYELNRDVIADKGRLVPGQLLLLPEDADTRRVTIRDRD